jgi:hypothetical protein
VAVGSAEGGFTDLCDASGVPYALLGTTVGTGTQAVLDIDGHVSVPLAVLREAWSAPLPAAFD